MMAFPAHLGSQALASLVLQVSGQGVRRFSSCPQKLERWLRGSCRLCVMPYVCLVLPLCGSSVIARSLSCLVWLELRGPSSAYWFPLKYGLNSTACNRSLAFGWLRSTRLKGRDRSCSAREGIVRAVVGCLSPPLVSSSVQVKSSHSITGEKATGTGLETSVLGVVHVSLQG